MSGPSGSDTATCRIPASASAASSAARVACRACSYSSLTTSRSVLSAASRAAASLRVMWCGLLSGGTAPNPAGRSRSRRGRGSGGGATHQRGRLAVFGGRALFDRVAERRLELSREPVLERDLHGHGAHLGERRLTLVV